MLNEYTKFAVILVKDQWEVVDFNQSQAGTIPIYHFFSDLKKAGMYAEGLNNRDKSSLFDIEVEPYNVMIIKYMSAKWDIIERLGYGVQIGMIGRLLNWVSHHHVRCPVVDFGAYGLGSPLVIMGGMHLHTMKPFEPMIDKRRVAYDEYEKMLTPHEFHQPHWRGYQRFKDESSFMLEAEIQHAIANKQLPL